MKKTNENKKQADINDFLKIIKLEPEADPGVMFGIINGIEKKENTRKSKKRKNNKLKENIYIYY